jgi:hypothetical protein
VPLAARAAASFTNQSQHHIGLKLQISHAAQEWEDNPCREIPPAPALRTILLAELLNELMKLLREHILDKPLLRHKLFQVRSKQRCQLAASWQAAVIASKRETSSL